MPADVVDADDQEPGVNAPQIHAIAEYAPVEYLAYDGEASYCAVEMAPAYALNACAQALGQVEREHHCHAEFDEGVEAPWVAADLGAAGGLVEVHTSFQIYCRYSTMDEVDQAWMEAWDGNHHYQGYQGVYQCYAQLTDRDDD